MAYRALAVGYVIESLTAAPSASTPDADERDENDEGGSAGSNETTVDGTTALSHKSDSDTTTGTEPDAESRLSTGIGDGIDVATDDDRNKIGLRPSYQPLRERNRPTFLGRTL